ncbi:hypothetical protein IHE45_14G090100 [Dioscorea alata]|uniref:Uncharacterized protein n=1 Tax=Dioscorea alata TaxID=55571 RepID=A0ACB7UTF5_DIOAL|nr:hypothetical protein IHE45_14G090100 [Dioscorea alata]
MTTSTRECHVMDIRSEQYSWEDIIGDEMKRFDPKNEEERRKKKSIYRIPAFLKLMKGSTVLTPQVVSFGPYHHDEENLKLLEGYKQMALLHFLHRNKKPLGHFTNAIKEVVEDLKAHYEFLEEKWNDEAEFIKLMMIDGCFMLEVLRFNCKSPETHHTANDPIFSDHASQHKLPYIKRDMLMLENQLPLLAIKVLIHAEKADQRNSPMTDREINNKVFKFLKMEDMIDKTSTLGLHILDLYRKGMIKTSIDDSSKSPQNKNEELVLISNSRGKGTDLDDHINKTATIKGDASMPTAMKLHESGVRFKKSSTNKINDICFDKGIFKLPHLIIDDSTESIFLNLMAFEHLHVGLDDEITSYVCFMDELSDSATDVHRLCSDDIIHNAVGSDQAAAEIINSLTKEVIHDPTRKFGEIRTKVKEYSERRFNKWLASLVHIYFQTPWTTIGLIAAVVLLILTFVQTFYAVVAYHFPEN